MFICTARRPIAPDAFEAGTGRHDPFGNEATDDKVLRFMGEPR